MIGIVIITHGDFGDSLIETLKLIIKDELEAVTAVSVELRVKADILREKIGKAVKEVNRNQGILILTDMFGGTPSNLSYTFLEEGRIEVLTGVNLPILLKAITERRNKNLTELVVNLEETGRKSISMASKLLRGNKKQKNEVL